MIAIQTAPNQNGAENEKFEELLPLIRRIAAIAFRGHPHERREDLIAEAVANAFCAFKRLVIRGKADLVYATPLARFAIKQVRSGRRVGGKLNVGDVSSEYAQQSKGFTVERLDRYNQRRAEWKEVLVEDRHAGPADIAACRIDFAAWLQTLSSKQRKAADLLATGETTSGVARKVGLSEGRISQIRRELMQAWELFHGFVDGADQTEIVGSLAACGEPGC